jgi:hypothetical protein
LLVRQRCIRECVDTHFDPDLAAGKGWEFEGAAGETGVHSCMDFLDWIRYFHGHLGLRW